MTPEALLAHAVRGRARLRVPTMRGRLDYFERVGQELAEVDGIKSVRTHPLTTSITIEFEGELDQLLSRAEEAGLFRASAELAPEAHVLTRVLERYSQGNEHMRRSTDGRLDFATLAFVGLALAGLYQIGRGAVLPPGVTLLRYAFDILTASRREARAPSEYVH